MENVKIFLRIKRENFHFHLLSIHYFIFTMEQSKLEAMRKRIEGQRNESLHRLMNEYM